MSQIDYFEKEGVPGKFFQCPKGLGVLSVGFCADSYKKSKTKEYIQESRRWQCRFCELGAAHSGNPAPQSRLFGSQLCARCERPSKRRIGGRICVSCYNRERENLSGKNAKGNPLQLIRHYSPVSLLVVTCESVQVRRFDRVLSFSEAMLSVVIREPGEVLFGEV